MTFHTTRLVMGVVALIVVAVTTWGAAVGFDRPAVTDAIQRAFCYDVYWRGRPYSLRQQVPVKIKLEGEHLRARLDGVFDGTFRMSLIVEGVREADRIHATIVKGYGLSQAPPEDREEFERGVVEAMIPLPRECNPRFDPTTPEKERTVETVIGSVSNFLLSSYLAGEQVPREVIITVANFNADYPHAYVLIEPLRVVYIVALRDPKDYANLAYRRGEGYLVGEIYNRWETSHYIRKIRAHSIIRKTVVVRP